MYAVKVFIASYRTAVNILKAMVTGVVRTTYTCVLLGTFQKTLLILESCFGYD